jgi:hypothetical protein
MKNKTQHSSDIDIFDSEVSIYKILYQDKTTTLLKHIIEQISADKYNNRVEKYPSLLLVGDTSKRLISIALSNSLCFAYEEVLGELISMGANCSSLFETVFTDTIYYVSRADKLTEYFISQFYQLLTHGYLRTSNPITRKREVVLLDNKMFIFSTKNINRVNPNLLKVISYQCFLQDCNSDSKLLLIVEQRLKWCSVNFSKIVPELIVKNSNGSISDCIRLLRICLMIVKGEWRSKITADDVMTGTVLLSGAEGKYEGM